MVRVNSVIIGFLCGLLLMTVFGFYHERQTGVLVWPAPPAPAATLFPVFVLETQWAQDDAVPTPTASTEAERMADGRRRLELLNTRFGILAEVDAQARATIMARMTAHPQ